MIRLVLLLCLGLYVTAMVLGEDRGQKRHGLMLADSQTEAAPGPIQSAASAPAFIPAPTFVPVQTVMLAPSPAATPDPAPVETAPVETAPVETVVAETVVAEPVPEPLPEIAGGVLYTVTASQANVRGGPGRSFAVVDSLSRGEQVLVVTESQPIEGWLRIRIEGDGGEGYIAASLVTQGG